MLLNWKHQDGSLARKNLIEQIIDKFSKKIRKRKKSDQWSKPKQKQHTKVNTKRRDIAKMLRALENESDSESMSGFDVSSSSDSEKPVQKGND